MKRRNYIYDGIFKTKEEVDAYFASEKIQCLLCGRWFENIGGYHMIRLHGISADDYREMYGFPWERGLSGKRCREKRIKLGKKLWREGIRPDMEKVRRMARETKRRPRQSHQRDYYSKTLSASRVSKPKYGREDMEAVLDRMEKEQHPGGCVRIFRRLLHGILLNGNTRSSWKNTAGSFSTSHIICRSRPAWFRQRFESKPCLARNPPPRVLRQLALCCLA